MYKLDNTLFFKDSNTKILKITKFLANLFITTLIFRLEAEYKTHTFFQKGANINKVFHCFRILSQRILKAVDY